MNLQLESLFYFEMWMRLTDVLQVTTLFCCNVSTLFLLAWSSHELNVRKPPPFQWIMLISLGNNLAIKILNIILTILNCICRWNNRNGFFWGARHSLYYTVRTEISLQLFLIFKIDFTTLINIWLHCCHKHVSF